MAYRSITTILAFDIATGVRDGLSIEDAAGFAWAMNPQATNGELSRAMNRARRMRPNKDEQSPVAFLSHLAGLALKHGHQDEQVAAKLWSLRPELSARHLALVMKSAKQNRGLHHG